MEIFATIICPVSVIEQARIAAAAIPGGDGMLTAGLSATGVEPATHYIASGIMPAEIVDVLSMCAISNTSPDVAIADKGLRICVSG